MIRLGIIGGGQVVRRHHWPTLQKLAHEIEVVAVARRNRAEALSFAREAGVSRIYERYEELLQDRQVDAVLTAVPIELNGRVLLNAIQAGKHVLAEKPIATTPGEARRILAENPRRRQVLLIGENFLYRRDLAKARALLQKGAIGEIFSFQWDVRFDVAAQARKLWISRGWRKEARHRGGFILDAGIHPVAALRKLLGEVSDLSAHVLDTSAVIQGPDSLLMQVQMASGVVGQCFFCYAAKEQYERPLDFSVFGTAGVLRVQPGIVTISRRVGGSPKSWKVAEMDGGYFRQWKNFCAAVRREESVLSTAENAYRDLLVIDAGLHSSSRGQRVRIGYRDKSCRAQISGRPNRGSTES